MSISLEPIEILKAVKEIDSEWQGYTDDYAIHENVAKAQLKKVAIKLQAIYNIPDLGACDRRMGEFIQGLLEEMGEDKTAKVR